MRESLYHGWYQVAFERELREKVTPLRIGRLSLMLIRDGRGIACYDAICPHRGAHLAFGGRLEGDAMVCPFHGHRIGLGCDSAHAERVTRYRTVTAGGLVFVLLAEKHENGLTALLQDLEQTHYFVPGFTLQARTPAEIVVENGFDGAHFECVHGLRERPTLRLSPHSNGELKIEGTFVADAFENVWHRGAERPTRSEIGFLARVFSPNVCISRLGDAASEHLVISGATPNGDGTCTIRVSVAAPGGADGKPPSEQAIRALLRDSRVAYEQDLVIWENRNHDAPSRFGEDDHLVVAFHRYCKQFLEGERDARDARPV
jgi:phenylpropionate dioxygenase-like ring-hydroxylating dioxygenase large terminal subunit